MIAAIESRAAPGAAWADEKTPPEPDRFGSWRSWFAVLVIAGYLLFVHGCHGDEDNELLASTAGQGRGTSITTGLGKNLISEPS
jgi:hypothetical protein